MLVARSARGRAQADAQGRCDGAGSERNRLSNPPVWRAAAPEGCSPLYHSPRSAAVADGPASPLGFTCPFLSVKLPSRGLGLSNAKIARLLLPGAPDDLFHGIGYAVLLHRRVSYPTSEGPSNQAVPLSVCDSEKLAGNDRENIGGRKCQTLQNSVLH